MKILHADISDVDVLASIAWQAKGHWDYPLEWMKNWRSVLSPDTSYIGENVVLKVEQAGKIVGWGALHFDPELGQWEIDHLWVLPSAIGQGIGKMLWKALCEEAKKSGVKELFILSDPHAKLFYEKMGAEFVKEVPSTPEGRTLPLMRAELG